MLSVTIDITTSAPPDYGGRRACRSVNGAIWPIGHWSSVVDMAMNHIVAGFNKIPSITMIILMTKVG